MPRYIISGIHAETRESASLEIDAATRHVARAQAEDVFERITRIVEKESGDIMFNGVKKQASGPFRGDQLPSYSTRYAVVTVLTLIGMLAMLTGGMFIVVAMKHGDGNLDVVFPGIIILLLGAMIIGLALILRTICEFMACQWHLHQQNSPPAGHAADPAATGD